jgi:isopentenyl diphosphate isomerase/L-lactate dehydrogenase-like FMN-dependent dehydrogenase
VKAAGAAKTLMTLSTGSTFSIEEVMAVATGPVWFQLYLFTFVIDRLILGQGRPAERWALTFDGEKLNVRVKLGDGVEISIDSETGG